MSFVPETQTQPEKSRPDYKTTLNLPQTSFPMKAGAATREPELQAQWETWQVYQQALNQAPKAHKFVLHDGPPYLSSDKIHIGTALNKILKDIVTRYKAQRGYYTPFVPGYDGHGLPIENAVVKNIKGGRSAITPAELRKRCREFAMANLQGQKNCFKRLGIWGNWEEPYVTIDAAFEALQIKLFWQMRQAGHVYKGLKPVYWCPSCETALADAEVEYADHLSHSIYVKFPVKSLNDEGRLENASLENAGLIIWTTTPWTLPANVALSVHPDFDYVVVDSEHHGRLVVAKGLFEAFAQAVELGAVQEIATLKGTDLFQTETQHPFLDRISVVLTGDHVTLEAGTGIVHTAPGHGMEDYVVCQAYNRDHPDKALPILSPLDNRGVFTPEAGERLAGQFYEKACDTVLDILKEQKALLAHTKYNHSYPHCWRCHNPVIYRATEQWFISIDGIRKQALHAIDQVTWLPERGKNRIGSMVENRGDWCISRQRVWGVPIPAFYCANNACKTELPLNAQRMGALVKLFEQYSSDIWWEAQSTTELLGRMGEDAVTCQHCGGQDFTREMDIMDVWFDSGVTHTAVMAARQDELGVLPAELYLEGSDQHRGWFQSSLLTSVMLNGQAPYKSVLTHGFVLDAEGRKMSKSLGNVVDPQTVINQYGADVLRLWVASVDYTNDVRIGGESLAQLAEVYKKVRNTIRYLLGNLADFDPVKHRVDLSSLSLLDRYVLHRLAGVVNTLTEAFDCYEFHVYYQVLQNFCVTELSALYFDVAKDVLYTHSLNDPTRRAMQTVLYEILKAMLPLLVPVMPHLAEDIWQHLPQNQRFSELESAVLLPWPKLPPDCYSLSAPEQQQAETLLGLKERVNKLLEAPRKSGQLSSSLQVALSLYPKTPLIEALYRQHQTLLPMLLIVSTVEVKSIETQSISERPAQADSQALVIDENDDLMLVAKISTDEKCARCWKYLPSVGQHPEHTSLCTPCCQAL